MFDEFNLDAISTLLAHNAVIVMCLNVAAGLYSECVVNSHGFNHAIMPIDNSSNIVIVSICITVMFSVIYACMIICEASDMPICASLAKACMYAPQLLYLMLSSSASTCREFTNHYNYVQLLIYAPIVILPATLSILFILNFITHMYLHIEWNCKYHNTEQSSPLINA